MRTQVDHAVERMTWVLMDRLREEWHGRHADLERRSAALEAAERRRQEGIVA